MRNKSELKTMFKRVAKAIANLDFDYDLKNASPEFCIQLLHYPNLKMFTKLNRKLKTSGKEWIVEFIELKGLFTLIVSIEDICNKRNKSHLIISLILSKCVCCIKEILNLKFGMESIIETVNEDPSCIQTLAKASLNQNQIVKKEIFQIYSAMAMYSEEGYSLCLRLLDNIKKLNSNTSRFEILTEDLKNNLNTDSYLAVIIGFINCLISQPEDLRERLYLRTEFKNLKLNNMLDDLKKRASEDLFIQIEVFEKFKREDEQEAFSKNGLDLTKPMDVFNAINFSIKHSTKTDEKFLELLQIIFQMIDIENNENTNIINKNFSIDKAFGILIETAREFTFFNKQKKAFVESCTQTEKISEEEGADFGKLKSIINSQLGSRQSNAFGKMPPPLPKFLPNKAKTVETVLNQLFTNQLHTQNENNSPAVPNIDPILSTQKENLNKSQTNLNVASSSKVVLRDKSPNKQTATQIEQAQNLTNIFNKRDVKPTAPKLEKVEIIQSNDFQKKQLPPPPPPPVQLNLTTVNTNQEVTQTLEKKQNIPKIPPQPSIPPPLQLAAQVPSLAEKNSKIAPPPPSPEVSNNSIPPPPPSSSGLNIPPPPPPPPLPSSSGLNIPPPPPPPPPPLLSNVPAPPSAPSSTLPPPPPLMAANEDTSSNQNTIYKTLPKSKKALKNLGWTKLPNTTLGKSNVWKELNEKNETTRLDFNLLEELFAKQTNISLNTKDLAETSSDIKSTLNKLPSMNSSIDNSLSFLDPKQSMNFNVYLKKIKIPLAQYIELIKNGKSKEIGIDNLSCLKKILPDKTEVEEIRSFFRSNPVQSVDLNKNKAEAFIKMLIDLPNFELRIDSMVFIEEFNDLYKDLNDKFKIFSKCSNSILKSDSLKKFIRLVLTAGNYINNNSYNGQAVGFRISILPKLIEIKTNRPSVTFLHVIVEQFDKEYKNDNFRFIDELTDLANIVGTSISNLTTDFRLLKKRTNDLLNEIKQETTSNDVKTQFLNEITKCSEKIQLLDNMLADIETDKAKLIDYYCEDALTFNHDEFLKIFHDLCMNINKVKEENKNRALTEEKILRRKMELNLIESKRKSLRNSSETSPEEQVNKEGDVLNNLLSNLKTGRVQRQSVRRGIATSPEVSSQQSIIGKLNSNFSQNEKNNQAPVISTLKNNLKLRNNLPIFQESRELK